MSLRMSTLFVITNIALTLSLARSSEGGLIFQDDFSSGNLDKWEFIGNDADQWGIVNGRLSTSIGSDDSYDGSLGIAVMKGVTTPTYFKVVADVRATKDNYVSGSYFSKFGHMGFVWSFDKNTYSYNTSPFSISYIRAHYNELTTWSAPYTSEKKMGIPSGISRGVFYQYSVEVNYGTKTATYRVNGNLIGQITSSEFDSYIKYSGNNFGLVNWGEEVEYDNVKLYDLSSNAVPEPSTLAIGLVFAVGAILFRQRR